MKHTLSNPVFTHNAARLAQEEIVQAKVECDPWYIANMKALLANWRSGHVEPVVFTNVAGRLNRIANHRAMI